MTIDNAHLIADNLGTKGCFPKAWVRKDNIFYLLKDGGIQSVDRELLASRICRCFDVNQTWYEEGYYDGEKVSCSKIMTSLNYSIVPMEHYEFYLLNHGMNKMEAILELDAYSYYMMNIIDYLIENIAKAFKNKIPAFRLKAGIDYYYDVCILQHTVFTLFFYELHI